MHTTCILQTIAFLHGAVDPDWFDGRPGQPGLIGPAISDYLVGELRREISNNLHDREIAATLHNVGKDLVLASSVRLVADLDEDHQLCYYLLPPFPHPKWWNDNRLMPSGPRPEPWAMGIPLPWRVDPQAELWLEHITPAMNDIMLAHALRELASLTSSEKASSAIKQAGETIIKNASSKLF